ncbi:hypothetical protein H112_08298 [Trichophyton rubrum D6]|uniref:Uncharacterized protein n=2 Tax=Trichophyton TaxID=5550 RepID=A0A022VQA4_TRIRU|nr:hypothetical protein H100_08320 [Trichophyton rubrum MR850]EZF37328.1 hypothetical protein H102_08279 [Trichophyton rubrum CBS 100081]EZF47953.1 hypothetical protein H103_08303 [Trichophyton rubrum CBS 288.86]EZF58575.1 hypothetical protein H104_08253 [Trichophyton rubrum CBS 289.86]EZF69154.1 hypothetical protein H105_08308 [Trichophyton soudanense CBS 452.61]EZF79956.1 hypothetical protein H110_08302 [Trichophyton rubrum MR1448]EZF90596.1 hypothetical protein H113_08371 [Trichophyton rub
MAQLPVSQQIMGYHCLLHRTRASIHKLYARAHDSMTPWHCPHPYRSRERYTEDRYVVLTPAIEGRLEGTRHKRDPILLLSHIHSSFTSPPCVRTVRSEHTIDRAYRRSPPSPEHYFFSIPLSLISGPPHQFGSGFLCLLQEYLKSVAILLSTSDRKNETINRTREREPEGSGFQKLQIANGWSRQGLLGIFPASPIHDPMPVSAWEGPKKGKRKPRKERDNYAWDFYVVICTKKQRPQVEKKGKRRSKRAKK